MANAAARAPWSAITSSIAAILSDHRAVRELTVQRCHVFLHPLPAALERRHAVGLDPCALFVSERAAERLLPG